MRRAKLLLEKCRQALAQVSLTLRRQCEAASSDSGELRFVFDGREGQHAMSVHGGEAPERVEQEGTRHPDTPGRIAAGRQARLDGANGRPLGEQAKDSIRAARLHRLARLHGGQVRSTTYRGERPA